MQIRSEKKLHRKRFAGDDALSEFADNTAI